MDPAGGEVDAEVPVGSRVEVGDIEGGKAASEVRALILGEVTWGL